MPQTQHQQTAVPQNGQIYSRRQIGQPEWWRVSGFLVGEEKAYVLLTRVDNRRKQTIVPIAELEDSSQFEKIEAVYGAK